LDVDKFRQGNPVLFSHPYIAYWIWELD
jgi:hypothetical protein